MDIKRLYATHCKKFLALFLAFVCLVTATLSPAIVFADDDMYVFKPEYTKIQGLMDYIMSGVMGVFPGDFNTFYQNNKQAYDDWYNKVYGYNYSGTDHGGGGKELTVKAEDMKELYNLVKQQWNALDGYYLITPTYSSLESAMLKAGYTKDEITTRINNGNVSLPCFYKSDDPYYDSFYFHFPSTTAFIDSGYLKYVVSYGDYEPFCYAYSRYSSMHQVNLMLTTIKDCIYVANSPFRIFYSKQDYLNWVNKGKSSVYVSSVFVNFSPANITINSDTVKNYTENNTTNKIYNETVNNITKQGGTSGESGLTQEQLQKIVDDAVQKVLDAMPTPTPEPTDTPTPTPTPGTGTGTDTPTPTPTPGGGSGDVPDSTTKDFFQKICDYFEENNKKLEDIVNLIDTAGKSECNYDYSELSGFLTTLWNESDKKFDTMINLLEKNNEYQEKMLDSLNQIKALLVVDTVLDVFKDRSTETANKAREKFPTSVPWDIAMVVNAMSAEPQAPVMKLPLVLEQFGISEEVTIDLSTDEWEKLAKLCRYMLSLLFLLFMVHLTRKLFYKDGDD